MKREIKFRAWDGKSFISELRYSRIGLTLDGDAVEMNNDSSESGWNYKDKLIISQFTGLHDKNGKEIYEGDILREPIQNAWEANNYSCFEVFFHDGDSNSDYNIGFTMNRMHNHGSVCGGYVPSFKPKTVKKMIVIGNIYENTELL